MRPQDNKCEWTSGPAVVSREVPLGLQMAAAEGSTAMPNERCNTVRSGDPCLWYGSCKPLVATASLASSCCQCRVSSGECQPCSVPIFIGWFEAGTFWADFLRKSLGPLSERHGPVRGAVRGKRGGLGGRRPPNAKFWTPHPKVGSPGGTCFDVPSESPHRRSERCSHQRYNIDSTTGSPCPSVRAIYGYVHRASMAYPSHCWTVVRLATCSFFLVFYRGGGGG